MSQQPAAIIPVPFIVGFPRSGTTLLRLMLDAHPQLSIPPETGFTGDLAAHPATDAIEAGDRMTRFPPSEPNWPDFQLSPELLRAELRKIESFSTREAVRTFYRTYAARFGKPRWGDKTPSHLSRMKEIAALLPEARLIHIIRDGRDAVVSLRNQWFAPSKEIAALAALWCQQIQSARQQAKSIAHCMEVRFEDLIHDRECTLRNICDFIDLPFDPRMLSHHENAAQRLLEHGDRLRTDGTPHVLRAQRRLQQLKSSGPPDVSQIGVWRTAMSPDEKLEFSRIANDLLVELGYEIFDAAT